MLDQFDKDLETRDRSTKYATFKKNMDVFLTSDRLVPPHMSRTDVVERIKNSSGLDYVLSDIALSLIEFRLDNLLSAGKVNIKGLGEVEIIRAIRNACNR